MFGTYCHIVMKSIFKKTINKNDYNIRENPNYTLAFEYLVCMIKLIK